MEVVRISSVNDLPIFNNSISLTMGEFDGIHLAHQELFKKTLEMAKKDNTLSAVLIFDPHPDEVLKKTPVYESIFSLDEKINAIEEYGFDYLLIVKFSLEIANMPHQEFTEKFLKQLKVKNLVVGYDFRYGYKGLGNYLTAKEQGIENVIVTGEVLFENQTISSTYIKNLLKDGDIDKANKLLGKYFKISGVVGYGKQIGTKIKVPTANLMLYNNYPTIKQGVYAVYCIIDNQRYSAIMNIGHNPSFNYNQNLSYEIHVIEEGFNKNLYGLKISVEFVKYLRNEVVFENIEAFKKQIKNDKKEANLILNNRL